MTSITHFHFERLAGVLVAQTFSFDSTDLYSIINSIVKYSIIPTVSVYLQKGSFYYTFENANIYKI